MAVGGNSSGGNSSGVRAGAAYVELYVKNMLGRQLGAAEKQWQNFGNSIGSIGRKMAGVGIAAGAGLAAVFAGSVKKSAEFGMLSLKFGESAENLSAFGYAAEQASLSGEEMTGFLKFFSSSLVEAKDKSSELGQQFTKLGLNADDMIGKSVVDNVIAFADAMNAGNLTVEERLDLLKKVGGRAGGQANEFLGGGSAEIRKMMTEAAEVGAVVTGEQAKQAKQIEDAFTKAWKSVKNAILSVGDALLPQADNIDRIVNGVTQVTMTVRQWVAANREVVIGVGLAAAGLTTIGIGLAILGPAISAVAGSWGALTGIVSASKVIFAGVGAILAAPFLAIPAAITAAGAAWLSFTTQGREAIGGFGEAIANAFGPTLENLKTSWAQIVDAVSNGDLATAFKIGAGAIRVEWARLMLYMQETWASFNVNWEKAISATSIALVRIGRRLRIYSKEEAADIEKTLLQMDNEAEQRMAPANQAGVKAAKFSLWDAERDLKLQKWFAERAKEQKAGWDFGDLANEDFGAGFDPNVRQQIDSIGSSSRSAFGGSISAGMFGGGDGVKKIVDAVGKVEKAILNLNPRDEARFAGAF